MVFAKLFALSALSLLCTVIQAQSSVGPCCTVDPSSVPQDERTDWCRAETSTCSAVCQAEHDSGTTTNSCDQNTLEFSCVCQSGGSPDMAAYQQSLPGQMCLFCSATASLASTRSLTTGPVTQPLSSDTSSSSGSTPTSSTPPSSETNSQPEPQSQESNGLSGGAIAGIVIGALLACLLIALLVWFLLRKRRRRMNAQGPRYPDGRSNEKEVVDPSDLPIKPELHGDSRPAELDSSSYSSELQSAPPYHHTELHGSPNTYTNHNSNLEQVAQHSDVFPQELHTRAPPSELNTQHTPAAAAAIPAQQDTTHVTSPVPSPRIPIPDPVAQAPEDTSNITSLPSPSPPPTQIPGHIAPAPLSAEEIAHLEEEERRIDAEMEEVRRMKELREQKFEIQKKLREAKGGRGAGET